MGGLKIMNQKLRVLLTLLVAVAFLTSATPIFATSSTKKEDSKKTTTSKSTKSKKKDSKKKTSKKKDTKKSSKAKPDKKVSKDSNKVPFKGKMNINKASKEELMKLPGIGEAKAEKIIKARKKMGKFKTSKDLMEISGIGEQTVKSLAKHLTF